MKKLTLFSVAAMASFSALALTPNASGVYEISSAAELEEFAAIVNAGNVTASAVLTKDIDMDKVTHTAIGNTKAVAFKGTWNGNFHTISSLNMEVEGGTNLALFGYVGVGAKISNTIIDDFSTFYGEDKCAAFVGQCSDSVEGFAEFTCLGSAASVHAYSADSGKGRASALVGPSDGNVWYKFVNCYNTGEVRGVTVGGMSCYAPKAYCYGCFTVTDVKKQADPSAKAGNPGKVGTVVIAGVTEYVEDWGWNFFIGSGNGFYPEVTGTAISMKVTPWIDYMDPNNNPYYHYGVYKITEDTMNNGTVCWYLNDGNETNPVWGQDLKAQDPYPTFLPGSPVVVKKGDAFEFENNGKTTETAGVAEIINDNTNGPKGIYTIHGVKVENASVPGIYIIDGKKVLVK